MGQYLRRVWCESNTTPAGTGHAHLLVHRRRPRSDRPRPLPPPAPPRPGEDGSPLAQKPGRRPHRDCPPHRVAPEHRPAVSGRIPRRRPGRVPPAQVGRPAERAARPRRHLGGLLPAEPAAVHGRGPDGDRAADRGAAGRDAGAAVLKKTLGLRWRKVGAIPAKADADAQAAFLDRCLDPRLKQAEAGRRSVFFVDAAHFVYGPVLGFLWCLVRQLVRAPAGRQRYSVLGALDAVAKWLVRITTTGGVGSGAVCQLLRAVADAVPFGPVT